jgi:hypothetical protein
MTQTSLYNVHNGRVSVTRLRQRVTRLRQRFLRLIVNTKTHQSDANALTQTRTQTLDADINRSQWIFGYVN